MSKLAHSNNKTMLKIDIRAALEDGNEDYILQHIEALEQELEEARKVAEFYAYEYTESGPTELLEDDMGEKAMQWLKEHSDN